MSDDGEPAAESRESVVLAKAAVWMGAVVGLVILVAVIACLARNWEQLTGQEAAPTAPAPPAAPR
jgi:hypothetical protein